MPSLVLLSGVSRTGQNIDLSDRTTSSGGKTLDEMLQQMEFNKRCTVTSSGGKTLDEMLQQMEFKKRLAIAIE